MNNNEAKMGLECFLGARLEEGNCPGDQGTDRSENKDGRHRRLYGNIVLV